MLGTRYLNTPKISTSKHTEYESRGFSFSFSNIKRRLHYVSFRQLPQVLSVFIQACWARSRKATRSATTLPPPHPPPNTTPFVGACENLNA